MAPSFSRINENFNDNGIRLSAIALFQGDLFYSPLMPASFKFRN